jgi:hypothetical protein
MHIHAYEGWLVGYRYQKVSRPKISVETEKLGHNPLAKHFFWPLVA